MLKKKKKKLFKKNIKVKNSSISTLVLSSTFHLFLSLSLSLHFAVLSHFTSEIEIEIEILLSCSSPKVKESQLLLLVSVNPLTLSQILCLCNFFIFFLHQKKVSLICEIGDNLFWFVFFFFLINFWFFDSFTWVKFLSFSFVDAISHATSFIADIYYLIVLM